MCVLSSRLFGILEDDTVHPSAGPFITIHHDVGWLMEEIGTHFVDLHGIKISLGSMCLIGWNCGFFLVIENRPFVNVKWERFAFWCSLE